MPKLSDVTQESLFYMFKGEPGTRKSTQALSFPTPQYWISTDQKMSALTIPSKLWNVDTNQVDFNNFSDWSQVKIKLEQLAVNCKFKTIIVDSVTSLGDAMNRQTLLSKVSGGADGKEKARKIGDIPIDSLESYKAEASGFRECIALLKDIQHHFKINIILIAHVVGERKVDERGITAHSRIIITGGKAISGKIVAYCDETYHFDIKQATNPELEGKYRCLTRHTGEDYARTTLPLPKVIEFGDDPLYSKYILPAIERNKSKETK